MSNRSSHNGEGPHEPSPLSEWTKSGEIQIAVPPERTERAFTPGTVLAGRYRVVALLGKGGMGEIYRAEDTKLGQTVALKFVRGVLSPEALQRLYAEVRIGRQVSHPNLCRLYDVVELEGETFLTMEYVDGEDLGSLLARIGRLAPDKALDLARDLCAGLAAVHDKGIVHRDLKPANVMVDGRGQARLTDFGLAVIRGDASENVVAGTPAYMAPEQLAGKEATPRSDLYALGLVLFQMFTGQRFFEAKTLTELMAQHREPKGPRLASISQRLDPGVERAILACLAEDESARPVSARAVLAALPGGDALDAAVAAGETPSPEQVAAAGQVGDLAPGRAAVCLLAALGGLVLSAYLLDRTALLRPDTLPRTPEWLAEHARDLLARLGHTEAADAAYAFEADGPYIDHLRRDLSPDRWQKLRATSFAPFSFYYRQSPRRLVAGNRDGIVRQGDPPSVVAGMAEVDLDARGRLTRFAAVPPLRESSSGPWPSPDWSLLLRETGLDVAQLRVVEPQWTAPHDSDHKAAWEGPTPWEPDQQVRVEAAAYHGRPVWFAVLRPWSLPDQLGQTRTPRSPAPVGQVAVFIFALAMPLGGVLLARRNLRLGRGDRQGAFRVALFVFATYTIARALRADHVLSFGEEVWILIKVVAYPSFWALQVWLLYMALEPYARRRWPHMLISWKRLVTGNLRDPLVGRDVLLGCVAGSVLVGLWFINTFPPAWLGMPPVTPERFLNASTLTSFRQVGFRLFVNQYSAVLFALVFLFMLVLLRVLLRQTGLAMALWCVLMGAPLFGENLPIEWATGLARAVVMLFVLIRGGLLGLTVTLFFMFNLVEAPLTLNLSTWYAGRALPVIAVLAGLALYSFHIALAGKPLFGRSLLED